MLSNDTLEIITVDVMVHISYQSNRSKVIYSSTSNYILGS